MHITDFSLDLMVFPPHLRDTSYLWVLSSYLSPRLVGRRPWCSGGCSNWPLVFPESKRPLFHSSSRGRRGNVSSVYVLLGRRECLVLVSTHSTDLKCTDVTRFYVRVYHVGSEGHCVQRYHVAVESWPWLLVSHGKRLPVTDGTER